MLCYCGLFSIKLKELEDELSEDELSEIKKNFDPDTIYIHITDKELDEKVENLKDVYLYRQPSVADSNTSTTDSIDGLISDSEKFLDKGENNKIKDESVQDFSKTIYNILIEISTFIAVLVGGIIGVKIMIASTEEKAQVKELLVPYIIGCVVVFGAFGIWKLVVNILQNI